MTADTGTTCQPRESMTREERIARARCMLRMSAQEHAQRIAASQAEQDARRAAIEAQDGAS